jgi:hypothetical protein
MAMMLALGTAGSLAAQQVELVSWVHPSQLSETGAGTPYNSFPGPPPSISGDGRYVVPTGGMWFS